MMTLKAGIERILMDRVLVSSRSTPAPMRQAWTRSTAPTPSPSRPSDPVLTCRPMSDSDLASASAGAIVEAWPGSSPRSKPVIRLVRPLSASRRLHGSQPQGRHHRASWRGQIDAGQRHGRRAEGEGDTVAVLAVDPSSPITGGALLGDRIRHAGSRRRPGGLRPFHGLEATSAACRLPRPRPLPSWREQASTWS